MQAQKVTKNNLPYRFVLGDLAVLEVISGPHGQVSAFDWVDPLEVLGIMVDWQCL